MDFKYRWKNGVPPNRDQAAQDGNLLDESQFETPEDHQMAENTARKQLSVPLQTADADKPPLPRAMPQPSEDQLE